MPPPAPAPTPPPAPAPPKPAETAPSKPAEAVTPAEDSRAAREARAAVIERYTAPSSTRHRGAQGRLARSRRRAGKRDRDGLQNRAIDRGPLRTARRRAYRAARPPASASAAIRADPRRPHAPAARRRRPLSLSTSARLGHRLHPAPAKCADSPRAWTLTRRSPVRRTVLDGSCSTARLAMAAPARRRSRCRRSRRSSRTCSARTASWSTARPSCRTDRRTRRISTARSSRTSSSSTSRSPAS